MRAQSLDSSMVSGDGSLVRRLAVAAGVAIAGALGATRASAAEVVVGVAPPVPRVEIVGRAPSPHHVWVPGFWGWRTHVGHVWYGGHWMEAQPGYTWEPARWYERGGYWHLSGGHWRRL